MAEQTSDAKNPKTDSKGATKSPRVLQKGEELYVDSIFANKRKTKEGKEFISYNATFRQRGDVNNNADHAGAFVSKYTGPSGKVSHTQFISRKGVNELFKLNGTNPPSTNEINKAADTHHPIAYASDKHTGEGIDRNLVCKADVISKNGFILADTQSITKSDQPNFNYGTEAKLNHDARLKRFSKDASTSKPAGKTVAKSSKKAEAEDEPEL